MSKKYSIGKEKAREAGKEFQRFVAEAALSYGYLCEIQDFLGRLAKRYGLIREFKANGLL